MPQFLSEEELSCPLLTPAASLQATTNWAHARSCAGVHRQPQSEFPKAFEVQLRVA